MFKHNQNNEIEMDKLKMNFQQIEEHLKHMEHKIATLRDHHERQKQIIDIDDANINCKVIRYVCEIIFIGVLMFGVGTLL